MIDIWYINPSTVPACEISVVERCMDAPVNGIFYDPEAHLFSTLRVLMKILSYAIAKKGFKFRTFIDRFQMISGQWRG